MSLPLLDQLLKKLATVDISNLAEPEKPIGKGETVIGVLSNDLKKMLLIASSAKKDAYEFAESKEEQTKATLSSSHKKQYLGQISALDHRADLFKDFFWTSLRWAFRDYAHFSTMGIRKGWIVVVSKNKTPSISKDFPFSDN